MRFVDQSNQEFRWEGEGSVCLARKKKPITKYCSFFLDDLKFEIGDFVLIRNDESVDPESVSNCYVAQIKELFDTADEYEPHQAKVLWFSRVTELPPYVSKLIAEIYDHEVIEEHRPGWSDVVDADTIFSKCMVNFLPTTSDFEAFDLYLEECEIPTFFCRYSFSGTKLNPKIRNDSIYPLSTGNQDQPAREFPTTGKRTSTVPTAEKDFYCVVPTGTSDYPKVVIKKLDRRLVENQNVKIIIARPDAKTIDDVAETVRDSLTLEPRSKKVEKRPIIHSMSASESDCSEIAVMKPQCFSGTPRKPTLVKKQEVLTPRSLRGRSSSKKTNSEAKARSSSRSSKLKNGTTKRISEVNNILNTPSPSRSRTPRRSAKSLVGEYDTLSSVPHPDSLNPVLSPSPSKKSRTVRRSLKFSVNATPQKETKLESCLSSPSPRKKPVSARKSIKFSDNQEVAVTRSGRKVKAVNYFAQQNNEESLLSSVIKKGKLSKFIRANYSDDSGSAYSASDSSDKEESMSDCSLPDEKPLKMSRRSLKKTTTTPRSSVKKSRELIMPERKTPLKAAQNALEESRLRLHVAAVPTSLPCREDEYSDIYSFVKGCLSAHTGGCMYISGVPGTGKTATVQEVVRNLEKEKEYGEVPLFTFVEVNGMWMTDPYQCYVHIFKSLTGKTIASQQAANLLEKRFTESGPKKDAVILLVDELDRLWTRKQTVMYNIFDWPSRKHSKLIVLAIANTMDLPERLMMNRISSRLGLTRKTFQPYTFRQLQEIIMSRIQELKVFDPDAVQFVARKVAAVSGDARRALDICRHATEVAEQSKSSPKKKRKMIVEMEHVDKAIQQMFSSPVIASIKCSSEMVKLFLSSMLQEFTRTGSEETTLIKVSKLLVSSCIFEGLKPPSSTEISNLCSQLAASHLILVDNFQNDIYMKLRLSVSPDDVNYALTGKVIS